jgi:hypothetical protein
MAIGAWQVINDLQYVQEDIYGVFPKNPTMAWIASQASLEPTVDVQLIPVPQLLSEDPAGFGTNWLKCILRINFFLQQGTGTKFLQYGINPLLSGLSPLSSLSMLFTAITSDGIKRFFEAIGPALHLSTWKGSWAM